MMKNSRLPELKIGVEVQFASALQARTVVKALIPDNVNLPEDLMLTIISRGKIVSVSIASRLSMMATAANTLDEILEHISISRGVMMYGG